MVQRHYTIIAEPPAAPSAPPPPPLLLTSAHAINARFHLFPSTWAEDGSLPLAGVLLHCFDGCAPRPAPLQSVPSYVGSAPPASLRCIRPQHTAPARP